MWMNLKQMGEEQQGLISFLKLAFRKRKHRYNQLFFKENSSQDFKCLKNFILT